MRLANTDASLAGGSFRGPSPAKTLHLTDGSRSFCGLTLEGWFKCSRDLSEALPTLKVLKFELTYHTLSSIAAENTGLTFFNSEKSRQNLSEKHVLVEELDCAHYLAANRSNRSGTQERSDSYLMSLQRMKTTKDSSLVRSFTP